MDFSGKRSLQRTLFDAGEIGLSTFLLTGGRSVRECLDEERIRARGGWADGEGPLGHVAPVPASQAPPLAATLARLPRQADLVVILDCRRTGAARALWQISPRLYWLGTSTGIFSVYRGLSDRGVLLHRAIECEGLGMLPVALVLRYGDFRIDRLVLSITTREEDPLLRTTILLHGAFTADQVTRLLTDLGGTVVDGRMNLEEHTLRFTDGEIAITPDEPQAEPGYADADAVAWIEEGQGCVHVRGTPLNLPVAVAFGKQMLVKAAFRDDALHLESVYSGLSEEQIAVVRAIPQTPPVLADPADFPGKTETPKLGDQPPEQFVKSYFNRPAPSLFSLTRFGEIVAANLPKMKVVATGDRAAITWSLPYASAGDALYSLTVLREAWRDFDQPARDCLREIDRLEVPADP